MATPDKQIQESGVRQKISHANRILGEQTLQEKNILPGLVCRFTYNKPKVYDRRPLVFIFQYDGNLIHGINFNYINKARIDKFAKLSQSLVPIQYENILRVKEDYPRLQLSNKRRASSVDGKLLYSTVMPRDVYFRNAYRTYKLSIIGSLKLVNFDFGISRTSESTKESLGRRVAAETVKKLKK